MPTQLCTIPGALIALMALLPYANAHAADAEYAVRWTKAAGVPGTLAAVSELLNVRGKKDGYDVRYFDALRPTDAPAGYDVILRERTKGGKAEVTWKYRRSADSSPAASAPPTASWRCPLNHELKRKDETDVSVLAAGVARRSFSRSCTAKGPIGVAVTSFAAGQKGCASRMLRRESEDESLTVEEWRLSNGEVVLEVSMKGADTPATLEAFRTQVVRKLLQAGIVPLDRSKSEIGTQCAR